MKSSFALIRSAAIALFLLSLFGFNRRIGSRTKRRDTRFGQIERIDPFHRHIAIRTYGPTSTWQVRWNEQTEVFDSEKRMTPAELAQDQWVSVRYENQGGLAVAERIEIVPVCSDDPSPSQP